MAFQSQPLPKPSALPVACPLNGASPSEQFRQRVNLLSRPYKPIKSSLAGISKLQSSNRKACL
ncbi:hypothetical protein E2I00_003628 [Balaenoptera physalus]|uniref:Uncharacterized protein n=1 Tax=Balaenoptera physalus TaxID=9770 RepID=A0A643C2W4_BALPH|nr:hypothetical protein E2I00_003628 [Balaenoptera physalus]